MKRILIICILLISISSKAQESQNNEAVLLEKINNLKNSGDVISEKYAIALNNLAVFYHNIKYYQKAEPLYLQSLDIYKKLTFEKPQGHVSCLNNLGYLYQVKEDYPKAEISYLEAYKLNININGEFDKSNINCLINIIAIYKLNKNFNKSQEYYLKLLKLQETVYGINHLEYVNTLFNIGYNLCNLELANEAESYFLKAFELNDSLNNYNLNRDIEFEKYEDNFNLNRVSKSYELLKIIYRVKKNRFLKVKTKAIANDYIEFLKFNIGVTYTAEGHFEVAEKYYIESVEISKSIYSINSIEYANSLIQLAKCNIFINKDKAINYFNQIIIIFEKLKIKCNEDYITSLDAISIGDLDLSNYKKKLEIQFKVLELKERCYGKSTIEYSKTLEHIGIIYKWFGDYNNSEKYFLNALTIQENIETKFNNNYFYTLLQLSSLYSSSGLYDKQFSALQSADQIHEVLLKNESIDTFSKYFLLSSWQYYYYNVQDYYSVKKVLERKIKIQNNDKMQKHDLEGYFKDLSSLALIESEMGNYDKSLEIYQKIIEIKESNSNKLPKYIGIAGVLAKLKRFDEAKYYFDKAYDIFNLLPKQNDHYDDTLLILSEFYVSINDYNKITNLYLKVLKSHNNFYINSANYMSTAELIDSYIAYRKENMIKSKFIENKINNSDIIEALYNNELVIRGLSLRNQQRIASSIRKSNNKELQINYENLLKNKKELNKINELPINNRPLNYSNLVSNTEQLEKELVKSSSIFSDSKKLISIDWKKIQNNLKPNQIVIDLVSFKYFNKKWTDSIVYCAYVIGKDYKAPKFISLFEEKQLNFNDEKNKNDNINNIYSNKSVSDLFLKPLEKELEGITTIYLSPNGLGHQIDFAALSINEKQTLGEKYKLHILSSPTELMDYKVAKLDKKSNIELLLYGGIDYDTSQGKSNISLNNNQNSLDEELNDLAKRSGIDKLPGTLKEVEDISINANKNSFNSIVFNNNQATEESIKALDGRETPYLLHIATHGFFFPDPIQEIPKENKRLEGKSKIYKASDDPMMRSGLLLAGAKNYWGKSNQNNTIEDGILTASEISNLDLSACQLVVLSACETGLGEVKGSEGVFGLQRAFKMAGVKNIIMSLWKVPDAQTAELFDIFYSECFAGNSIHEAFRFAQSKMKTKYSPYYWAGFVLLE